MMNKAKKNKNKQPVIISGRNKNTDVHVDKQNSLDAGAVINK
jgi:hypothetical protein